MTKLRLTSQIMIATVILSTVASPACLSQGANPADVSGPVDIQANEQEFAGDQIIAKGNVRVVYKDSVIRGPQATLQRDPNGSPQQAVFSGHPHFVQGKNLIDADTLMFDIAKSIVVADGHAHSEVEQSEGSTGDSNKTDKASTTSKKPLAPTGLKSKKSSQPSGGEKIITDADHQVYDSNEDKFEATGHVKVIHTDIVVHAEKLQLVYGTDKKPETAIFTGGVVAQQGQNNTIADNITYSLSTRRLQASGHVKSKVIQPKKSDTIKKAEASGGGAAPGSPTRLQSAPGAAYAATTSNATPNTSSDNEPIIVTSNSQENSEETGRLSADGNVKVYYEDMVGAGPKAILVRNAEGRAERVYFVGRSQVVQSGRRWIADRITISVADKKVLAEGNSKALIIQQGPVKSSPSNQNVAPSKLASKTGSATTSISASKVVTPQ